MKRTMVLLLLVEEDEPRPFDTDGAELDELSAITPKAVLAKCGELAADDARRRKAGGSK
jgi:hypothetical protein